MNDSEKSADGFSPADSYPQPPASRRRVAVLGLLLAAVALGGGYAAYRSSNAYQLKILLRSQRWSTEREQALQRLLKGASPQELADLIEGIDDPGKRGAYPSLVLATKDPRLAPYILHYVTQERPPVTPGEAETATAHLQAIRGFGDHVAADILFPAYEDSAHGEFVREAIYGALIQLPPDVLRERVLALASSVRRGAFPEVLAATGDRSHVPAIVTWASSGGDWARAAKALVALAPKRAAALLVGAYASGTQPLRGVLLQRFTPQQLAPEIAKRPELHGEFPQALAAHGDPAFAPALFQYVTSERIHPSNTTYWRRYADALVALGPGVLPETRRRLDSAERFEARLALEVLFRLAPNEGAQRVNGILSAYQKLLIRNWSQIKFSARRDPWGDTGFTDDEQAFYRWREKLHPVRALEAIADVKSPQADFCFLYGLSSPDPGVARRSARALDKRLKVNQLVDALFRFIAGKDSFSESEANVYHGLLNAKGRAAAGRVVLNLDRLLKEAAGAPEKVFFLYKILGVRFLEAHGTSAALPTVDRYARDPSSYVQETTRTRSFGGLQRSETERSRRTIRFAEEWARARRALAGRN